jgi:hypothetical protein
VRGPSSLPRVRTREKLPKTQVRARPATRDYLLFGRNERSARVLR